MSENGPPDSLRDLDARLRRFREETREKTEHDESLPRGPMSGLGMALRTGTELVSALIVGVGIGFFLDKWLGTTPWFLVVFFFLGAAAGILNVYRAASGQGFGSPDGKTEQSSPPGSDGAGDTDKSRDG